MEGLPAVTLALYAAPDMMRPAWRFFRTPKGLLLLLFTPIVALAVFAQDPDDVLLNLATGAVVAAAFDMAIVRLKRDEWILPDGALLTGMLVAMVLQAQAPLPVIAATSAIAIAGKHLLRTRWSNVFNPAALGLVVSYLLFQTGQSWWGALPDLGLAGAVAVLATGLLMADRLNKLPLVLVFLGVYFVLFTEASFLTNASAVAEVFRAPDLHAALFFALFMLDDPPTCPVRYRDQAAFGLIAAVVSYIALVSLGVVYFLLLGALAANAAESVRRLYLRRFSAITG